MHNANGRNGASCRDRAWFENGRLCLWSGCPWCRMNSTPTDGIRLARRGIRWRTGPRICEGKAATLGLPIYQMMGDVRDKNMACASSPLLPENACIAYCHRAVGCGYHAIKFHPYRRFRVDSLLVQRLREECADPGNLIGMQTTHSMKRSAWVVFLVRQDGSF